MLDSLLLKVKEVLGYAQSTPMIDYCASLEKNEYQASTFCLSTSKFIYREAKITPKKVGLFVAIWKRNSQGITAPYNETDDFDYLLLAIDTPDAKGFFLYPKSALADLQIITTSKKEGKRGMRVYPLLEEVMNKEAQTTFKKQQHYFYKLP